MNSAFDRFVSKQTASQGEADTALEEVIAASVLLSNHLAHMNRKRLKKSLPSEQVDEGSMNSSSLSSRGGSSNSSKSSSDPSLSHELFHQLVQKNLAVPIEVFLARLKSEDHSTGSDFLGKGGATSARGTESPGGEEDLGVELDGSMSGGDIFSAFSGEFSFGKQLDVDLWSVQFQDKVLKFTQHVATMYVKTSDVYLPDVAAMSSTAQRLQDASSGSSYSDFFPKLQTIPGSKSNHLFDTVRHVLVRIWDSRREARKFHRAFRSLREAAIEALLPSCFATLYSVLFAYRGRVVSVTMLVPISSPHPCVLPDSHQHTALRSLPDAPATIIGSYEAAWRVALGCFGLPAATEIPSGGAAHPAGPRKRQFSTTEARKVRDSTDTILSAPLSLYLGLDGRLYCLTLAHLASSQQLADQRAVSNPSAAFTHCTGNISPFVGCASFTSDVLRREELCTQAAIRCLQQDAAASPSSPASGSGAPTPSTRNQQRERNHVRAAVKALHGAEASLTAAGIVAASLEGVSAIMHAEGCNMSLLGHVLLQLCAHIKAETGAKRGLAAVIQAAAVSRAVIPCVLRRLLVSLMSLYVTLRASDCAHSPPLLDSLHPSFASDKDVIACAENLLVQLYNDEAISVEPFQVPANGFPEKNAGIAELMMLAERKYQVPNDMFLYALQVGGASFSMFAAFQDTLLRVGLMYDDMLEIIVPCAGAAFLCDAGRSTFVVGQYWTARKQQMEFDVWGKAVCALRKKAAGTPRNDNSRLASGKDSARSTSPMLGKPEEGGGFLDASQAASTRSVSPLRVDVDSGSFGDEAKPASSPRHSICPVLSVMYHHLPAVISGTEALQLSHASEGSSAPADPMVVSLAGAGLDSLWFHYGKVARWVFSALCSPSRSQRRIPIDLLCQFSAVSPVGSRLFQDPGAFLCPRELSDQGQPVHSAVDVLTAEKRIAHEQLLMLRLALHFSEVMDDTAAPYRQDPSRRGSVTRVGRRASTTVSVNLCQMTLAGSSSAVLQVLRIANFGNAQSSSSENNLGLPSGVDRLKPVTSERVARDNNFRTLGICALDALILSTEYCADISRLLPRVSSSVEEEIHFDCVATSAKTLLHLLLGTSSEDFFSRATLQQPMNAWSVFKSKVSKPLHTPPFTTVVLLFANLVRRFGNQLSPTITSTVNHPFFIRLSSSRRSLMIFYDYIMEYSFRVADIPKYMELFRLLIRLSTPYDMSAAITSESCVGAGSGGHTVGLRSVERGLEKATIDDENRLLHSLLYWTLAYFPDLVRFDKTLEQALEVLHLLWCVSRRTMLLYRLEDAVLCLLTETYFRQRSRLEFDDRSDGDSGQTSSSAVEEEGRTEQHMFGELSCAMHIISMAQQFMRRSAALSVAQTEGATTGQRRPSTLPGSNDGEEDAAPRMHGSKTLSPIDIVHEKLAPLDSLDVKPTLLVHISAAEAARLEHHRSARTEQQPELLFLTALRTQLEFSIGSRKTERYLLGQEEDNRKEIEQHFIFAGEVAKAEFDIEKKLMLRAAELQSQSSATVFADDDDEFGMGGRGAPLGTSMVEGSGVFSSARRGSGLDWSRKSGSTGNLFGKLSVSEKNIGGGRTGKEGGNIANVTTLILSTSAEAECLLVRLKHVQSSARAWTSRRILLARMCLGDPQSTFDFRERWDLLETRDRVGLLTEFGRNLQLIGFHHLQHVEEIRLLSLNVAQRRRSSAAAARHRADDDREDDPDDRKLNDEEASLRQALTGHHVLDTSHELFLRRITTDDVISDILYNADFDHCRLSLLVAMLVSAVHCSGIASFTRVAAGESAIRRAADVLLAQLTGIFLHLENGRAFPGRRGTVGDAQVAFGNLTRFSIKELFVKLALFLQGCASHDILPQSSTGLVDSQSQAAAAALIDEHTKRVHVMNLFRGKNAEAIGPSSLGICVATVILVCDQMMKELSIKSSLPVEHEQLLRDVQLGVIGFAGSGPGDREDLRREMLVIPSDRATQLDELRLFLTAFVQIGDSCGKTAVNGAGRTGRRRKTMVDVSEYENATNMAKIKKYSTSISAALKFSGRHEKDIPRDFFMLVSRIVLVVEGYLPALLRDISNKEGDARRTIIQNEQFAFFDLLKDTIVVLSQDRQLLLQETREPMFRQIIVGKECRLRAVIIADEEAEHELVSAVDAKHAQQAEMLALDADRIRRLFLFQHSDRDELERTEACERDQIIWSLFHTTAPALGDKRKKLNATAGTAHGCSTSPGTLDKAVTALIIRHEADRNVIESDEARAFTAIANCSVLDLRILLFFYDTHRRNELFEVGFSGDAQEQRDDEIELGHAFAALKNSDPKSAAAQHQQHRVLKLLQKVLGQLTAREMVARHLISTEQDAGREHMAQLMVQQRNLDSVLRYDWWLEKLKQTIAAFEDEELLGRRKIERAREQHHSQLCQSANPSVLAHCLASLRAQEALVLMPSEASDRMLDEEVSGRFAIEHEHRQCARLIIELSHRDIGLLCDRQPIEWQELVALQHELQHEESKGRMHIEDEEEETYFRNSYEFDLMYGGDDATTSDECSAVDEDGVAMGGSSLRIFHPLNDDGLSHHLQCGDEDGDSLVSGRALVSRNGTAPSRARGVVAPTLTAATLAQHQSLLERARSVASQVTAGTLTPFPPPPLQPSSAKSPQVAARLSSVPPSDAAGPRSLSRMIDCPPPRSERLSQPAVTVTLARSEAADNELFKITLGGSPLVDGGSRKDDLSLGTPSQLHPSAPQLNSARLLPAAPQRSVSGFRSAGGEILRSPAGPHLPRIIANSQISAKNRSLRPVVLAATVALQNEEIVERSIVHDEYEAAWTVMTLAWSRNLLENRLRQQNGRTRFRR